jgi:hypothetical protein
MAAWCGARAHAGAVIALRVRVATQPTTALKHPRRRGYPPGMGVEAIAHRSSLSTGRGRKTGSAAAFSDEVRAPVAGGSLATGRRERELSSTFHERKATRRGSGSAHRGRARDGGGDRTTTVARSDSVGRLRTWTTARSGRAHVRRGKATARLGQWWRGRDGCRDAGAWSRQCIKAHERRGRMAATRRWRADRRARRVKWRLTGGPHSSAFFELNLLPNENNSK